MCAPESCSKRGRRGLEVLKSIQEKLRVSTRIEIRPMLRLYEVLGLTSALCSDTGVERSWGMLDRVES
jgi:hypothetical protein